MAQPTSPVAATQNLAALLRRRGIFICATNGLCGGAGARINSSPLNRRWSDRRGPWTERLPRAPPPPLSPHVRSHHAGTTSLVPGTNEEALPTNAEPGREVTDQQGLTPADSQDIDAFSQQARWLLEWHNKRSDGFATRSVAILGFDGVILALLPRGLDPRGGIEVTLGLKTTLILTAALLFMTAAFCLLVLAPQRSNAPSISQIRQQWGDYADARQGPRPQAQVAESLLHGRSATSNSPLDHAYIEANRRGRWFKCAVLSLGAALLALASLTVQVFWQM